MKRLKDLYVDPKTGALNLDIMEQNSSFAIVECEGRARATLLPEHGETKIVTHQGKVKRIKYDGGSNFKFVKLEFVC
ncbi:XtrA/YqaO family protein [Alteribacillus sp. HJP-4]|uniref:XtrA/YqaO family protein n=1 Tax=Alteribacillus sp. HJP-4 TaxID=2775394 RepID=UPI0035CD3B39